MTSEYVHGHEFDTYHYEDVEHRPLHFTVTKPDEHDIIEKGQYYHAHPSQISHSAAHHSYEPAHTKSSRHYYSEEGQYPTHHSYSNYE